MSIKCKKRNAELNALLVASFWTGKKQFNWVSPFQLLTKLISWLASVAAVTFTGKKCEEERYIFKAADWRRHRLKCHESSSREARISETDCVQSGFLCLPFSPANVFFVSCYLSLLRCRRLNFQVAVLSRIKNYRWHLICYLWSQNGWKGRLFIAMILFNFETGFWLYELMRITDKLWTLLKSTIHSCSNIS